MEILPSSEGATLAKITAPGVVFCHSCDADVHWERMGRGSFRLRCVRCKSVFPCYNDCEHMDCQSVRELWHECPSQT